MSRMHARNAIAPLFLAALAISCSATGAGLDECLKLAALPDGSARLANVCGDRLNIIYCIDHADSPKACSGASLPVTTLFPNAQDPIASYSGGALRAAVCVYPEAPVGWQPGADSTYSCKKTCVMC